MKKATVLGLSSNNKLIVSIDDNQNFIETRFEGFDITENDIKLRPLLDQLLGKDIECSINKNEKTLRYQNESLFTSLLEKGGLTVNAKELEESKIQTSEQKIKFTQIIKSSESQQLSSNVIFLNDKQNSSLLQSLMNSTVTIKAKIEYLAENLLVRFVYEGRLAFLKCKIENCKHYFQLFPQVTFWKAKFLPTQIQIKIVSKKYNLLEKSVEVFVQLQDEIVEKLISQGWVALNQKNYFKNSKDSFKKLMSIENESIKSTKGIYSSKSQILSFIYAKNNYVGVVTNIIEGYIYQITALKTQQSTRIQLSMVICPVGNDAGAFECREFARRQLIGKQVNVYLHKEEGFNTTGNIIRVEDWKDIESVLLQKGYAVVRQEFKTSILGQKLSVIEGKARQKKHGIHLKDLGVKRFEDLTQAPFSKSHFEIFLNRRLQVLSKFGQREQVVIQQVISSLNYKVRIESLHILLNIRLQGVTEPALNPNLKEYIQINSKADKFLNRNFHQRTMIASISDYDQDTNSFIGTLLLQKEKMELQEVLIQKCLVYADKYDFVKRYHDIQTQAKKTQKLIWQPQLRCFEPGYDLDKEKYCFEGKFSWIHNGKIAYVQPKDNFDTLEKLQAKLRKLKLGTLSQQKIKIGAWCAAPYEGDLYRAVIKQRKNNIVTVKFFDWGNQENLSIDLLKQLPQEFLYVQKQCIRVSLNLVSPTNNKEMLQKVKQMLFDGGLYVFKKVYGDSVEFFAQEAASVNEELIMKGLLKADKGEIKRYENAELIKNVQQELRKERVGVWEESDSSDEETEQY